MFKKIFFVLASAFSSVAMAAPGDSCPTPVDHTNPTFCSSWQTAVTCECKLHGGGVVCNSMERIFVSMMLSNNHSIVKSCQSSDDPTECVASWCAYMEGDAKVQGLLGECQPKSSYPFICNGAGMS